MSASSRRSNLKSHQDGSKQAGKSGAGCARRNQAITASAKLPPTKTKLLRQRLQQDHQNSLAAFLNSAPKFSVKTLNQCLAVWQVAQALTLTRIEDPILKSIMYWLCPDAQVFG